MTRDQISLRKAFIIFRGRSPSSGKVFLNVSENSRKTVLVKPRRCRDAHKHFSGELTAWSVQMSCFLQNASGRLLVNCEWLLSFISEFLEFCGGPGCSPVRIPILVTMQHSRWILFWKSCSLEVLLKQEFKTKYDLKI